MKTAAGLSLVGFMEEGQARSYLRRQCAFEDDESDARLEHEWRTAKSRIGAPMEKMGLPEIYDIPASMRAYIDELTRQEWVIHRLNGSLAGGEFKMVEIDPLLAFQFSIDIERSTELCSAFSGSKREEDLFHLCLPIEQPSLDIHLYRDHKGSGSMLINTKNLSVTIAKDGAHNISTDQGNKFLMGIEVTTPPPLLHVVRHQYRFYLHNGFHRAYSARLAGATHLPCIVRTVSHEGDIGIAAQTTFGMKELRASHPPTLGHYTGGRAHEVRLKSLTRLIQVSWSEYTV
jgi:hypothetical protein